MLRNGYVTNTKFLHKMGHTTPWTAPYRKYKMKMSGQERRTPIGTQIDYIMLNKKYLNFVQNSRSYSGTKTDSEHKLVKMKMKIELYKMTEEDQKQAQDEKVAIENFAYKEKKSRIQRNSRQIRKTN